MSPRATPFVLLAGIAACSGASARTHNPEPPPASVAPSENAVASGVAPKAKVDAGVPCGSASCTASEACCWDPKSHRGSCSADPCPGASYKEPTDTVEIRCVGDCDADRFCSTDLDMKRPMLTYECRGAETTTMNVICSTVDDCPSALQAPSGCVADEHLPEPLKICQY